MSKDVLQFEEVTFGYGESVPILKDFNFSVSKGEFVSIIGPSGCGKSTLFRLITGLEQPLSGKIKINDQVENQRLGKVGYMPQRDLLLEWRTIVENAALPLELKGIRKKEARQQVIKLLEEFGLKGVEDSFPNDLSGGMRQRVSFLRTVLSGSDVFLLDEPFSALDAITRITMQEWLLDQWEKWNKTVLFITHDVEEALFLSDRILVFTEKPVSTLKEVQVPLKRPRTIKNIGRPEIVSLKEQLIEELRSRVKI